MTQDQLKGHDRSFITIYFDILPSLESRQCVSHGKIWNWISGFRDIVNQNRAIEPESIVSYENNFSLKIDFQEMQEFFPGFSP